jgi:site-specific recombinase XerD
MTHAPTSPPTRLALEQIFQTRIQILATTLQHSTVNNYRCTVRRFLSYLHAEFPQVRRLSRLRRDPHLFGWFRSLCEQHRPLSNKTRQQYMLCLRRLFDDLARDGCSLQPDLIRTDDFPPQPKYLPKPLSPEEDQRLQEELRRANDLPANALLLTRATGIRIGECINLTLDCLRSLGPDRWALHVPLGKLYTERLVPVDENGRQIIARILELRAGVICPSSPAKSGGLLLPRSAGFASSYQTLCKCLRRAAERAACSTRVTPHRLRHTFATEMLRLGVSLPALMQLLGHKDISMTLRYLQVTQDDLQREFHLACQSIAQRHLIPKLALPDGSLPVISDLPTIRRALEATRHLLEMYRRQLDNEKSRRRLQRLGKRIMAVAAELDRVATVEK